MTEPKQTKRKTLTKVASETEAKRAAATAEAEQVAQEEAVTILDAADQHFTFIDYEKNMNRRNALVLRAVLEVLTPEQRAAVLRRVRP